MSVFLCILGGLGGDSGACGGGVYGGGDCGVVCGDVDGGVSGLVNNESGVGLVDSLCWGGSHN